MKCPSCKAEGFTIVKHRPKTAQNTARWRRSYREQAVMQCAMCGHKEFFT